MKLADRKRWVLAFAREEAELQYVKKPEQKQLYKLQYTLLNNFLNLLHETNIMDKVHDKIEFLHSVIIQEFKDQSRLYFVFYIPDSEGVPKESKKAVRTVGNRVKIEEEREAEVKILHEIKSVFGALRNLSKAIESLH